MLGDAAAGGARPEEDNFLFAQLTAGAAAGGDQRPDGHRRGTLDIVVKGADLIAVAVEQRHGVLLRKVFKLQQHVRPAGLNRLDHVVNELVVLVIGNTRVAPAHIQRIVQQLLVVCSDVQHDGQGVSRADAAAGGVQRQFTDRDPHSADPLVAEAENALAIGDHNHFHVVVRDVLQDVVKVMAILVGDKDAAGATVNLGETFAGGAYRRGIDNRHHLFEMVANQAIEKGLVGVLDVTQVNVFVDFCFESLILDPRAFRLLFDGFNHFRQQAKKVETAALFHTEGAALVEQGEFKQNGTRVGDVQGTVFLMGKLHRTNSLIVSTVPARR